MGVLQAHEARHIRHERLGLDEHFSELRIELARQRAREFEMLELVLAHGHRFRVIEQDIRRHKDGVGEKAHVRRILLAALLFELRHALEFRNGRNAIQNPGKLCMFFHL